MRDDIDRWNAKYRKRGPGGPAPEADGDLVRLEAYFPRGGLALDLACGLGHNTRHLARLGFEVLAVDASIEALRRCRTAMEDEPLSVKLLAADLDHWSPPLDHFDLMVVVRFLNRSLMPRLTRSLKSGGVLFYKTFNENFLKEKPTFPAAYVLEPGELSQCFPDLEMLETNETEPLADSQSYWIGRKR